MLIIIAAHLPIFALQRHEGRIFAPMAWTVTSALIGSLLLSLTVVPLLCYYLLRRPIPHEDNWVVRTAKQLYEPVLRGALARWRLVLELPLASLAVTGWCSPVWAVSFSPNSARHHLGQYHLPRGVAEEARQRAPDAGTHPDRPEVNTVVSKCDALRDGTDPKALNMLECFVDLKPASQWKPGVTKAGLSAMDRALDSPTRTGNEFSQPIRDNVLESISQIDGPVVIKVFGEGCRHASTSGGRHPAPGAGVPALPGVY